ncbi:unnamed protein product [Adineta ricciae]|uniref:Nuclear speckle splicing regulatory protein 1 N-terminal domain-containing protein n=1 Tax=Adineta ricciae TaxID=249248 RepID=A0A814WCP0_ADIRI|nr:unnamed protein product [Adineta ricciae]
MATEDHSSSSKRSFGLSFPSKPKTKSTTITPINKNCFAASAFSLDDDDDADTKKTMSKPPTSSRLALNPKAQRDIEQALEQDPNIYEYDEVYEQVSSTVQQEQRREEKKRLERESNTVRAPKYIAGLLEKKVLREKEHERREERRIQLEREAEGDLYKDKEVFVTSAYKAKLAERQADIEREKLEEKREALLNSFQQDNMDAFYRFQFKLRTGEETILEESEKTKTEPKFEKPSATSRNARQLRTRTANEDDDEVMDGGSVEGENDNMYTRAREKHAREVKQEQRQDDDEAPVVVEKSVKQPVKVRRINDPSTQVYDDEEFEMDVSTTKKEKKPEKAKEGKVNTKDNDEAMVSMPIATEKKRVAQETRIERIRRLCEKRTVDDVLEAAKQAYYERQQKRDLYKDYIERAEA